MIVQQLDGLEWHDGWLASIIHTDDGKSYAACAVAIDWNRRRRRFALCQISQAQAASLREMHTNFGFSPEFNEAWKAALSCDSVYLVNAEPCSGKSLALEESTAAERQLLNAYLLPLVEHASSEGARRTWLNK